MKFLYLYLFLAVLSSAASAQITASVSDSIIAIEMMREARISSDALVAQDADAFLTYTHPAIMDQNGGKEKMKEILKKGSEVMAQQGASFRSVSLGIPSKLIRAEGTLQSVIPTTIIMKVKEGSLLMKSCLIAISYDEGKSWKFIDGGTHDLATMRNGIPELSSKLTLIPVTPPQFQHE